MDYIIEAYNSDAAVALLYFLVFLGPFALSMFYLVRQHNRWKKYYSALYNRLADLTRKLSMKGGLSAEKELGGIVTNEAIKSLEMDLAAVEKQVGCAKQAVVFNRFAPKPKKMKVLDRRLSKAEARFADAV